jgi:hypothetical protein
MIARRGQATVEWVAVLVVATLLAAGLAANVRAVATRAIREATWLGAVASAGAGRDRSPRQPLLGGRSLPALDGGSIVTVAAQIARAGIVEVPPGSNRGPGVDVFTDGNAEAWCADFVSWVLRAAGHPFTGGASAGWRLAWTGAVRSWFIARAAYRDRLVADPRPGDVVWFVHGHVGIVEGVQGDDLKTIEGNAGDAVARRVYPHWRLDPDIGGFGRPGVQEHRG